MYGSYSRPDHEAPGLSLAGVFKALRPCKSQRKADLHLFYTHGAKLQQIQREHAWKQVCSLSLPGRPPGKSPFDKARRTVIM